MRPSMYALFAALLIAVVPGVLADEVSAPAASDPLAAGIAQLEAGDYESAAAFFQKRATASPKDARALSYLGRAQFNLNSADEAVESLTTATELDPDNSDYHLWLGRAYLQQLQTASMFKKLGLSKKVRAEYGKAIELDPNNLDARASLAGYYFEAPGIAGGSTEKGMEQVAAIKERDPLRGHLVMGSRYHGDEEYELAQQEFKSALALDPESTDAHFLLAILYHAMERWDDAFATLAKLLEIDPGNRSGLYQTGRTASLSGKQLDRGIEAFGRYLQGRPGPDEPSLAWAHYRRGLIYEHKGDSARALADYRAALELDPKHDQAKKALKKLS